VANVNTWLLEVTARADRVSLEEVTFNMNDVGSIALFFPVMAEKKNADLSKD
jgi:hypothetical protein